MIKSLGEFGLLTTGDFDEEKFPIPPLPITPSRTECLHTPVPESYHSLEEWVTMASKTHAQIRCPHCGNWAIWVPKAQAKIINAAHDKESKRIERQMEIMLANEQIRSANKVLKRARRRKDA